MKTRVKKMIKELIPYILILLFVVVVRSYFVTPVMVSGTSMSPTLKGNEIMLLNKMDKKYKRYDIVVVDTDNGDIIKRVIALPGETIQCKDNKIFVNSRKIEENYGSGITSNIERIKLGKDEYFVLGDNRENSMDSRYYGPIKSSEIKGKAKFILLPVKEFGKVE